MLEKSFTYIDDDVLDQLKVAPRYKKLKIRSKFEKSSVALRNYRRRSSMQANKFKNKLRHQTRLELPKLEESVMTLENLIRFTSRVKARVRKTKKQIAYQESMLQIEKDVHQSHEIAEYIIDLLCKNVAVCHDQFTAVMDSRNKINSNLKAIISN